MTFKPFDILTKGQRLKDSSLSFNHLWGKPLIILSITQNTLRKGLEYAKEKKVRCVEIRGDLFEKSNIIPACEKFFKEGVDVILTLRHSSEGGKMEDNERIPVFVEAMEHISALDVEISKISSLSDVIKKATDQKKGLIFSYHNFEKTPPFSFLKEVIASVRNFDRKIVKIATHIQNPEDINTLSKLLISSRKEFLTIIGMGENAKASRILFPLLGSLLIYVNPGEKTAPGQLSLEETQHIFKKLQINYL